MSSPERQRRIRTALVGVMITVGVCVLNAIGAFAPLERWLYDARVRHCQLFMPQPSDELALILIDDASLETIGRWPWGRSRLAQMVNVLEESGTRAIAFDILLSEPQPPEYRIGDDGQAQVINHDKALADAMATQGRVIPAASFAAKLGGLQRKIGAATFEMLRSHPQSSYDDVTGELVQKRMIRSKAELPPDIYGQARRLAVLGRVEALLNENPDLSPDEIETKLYPDVDAALVNTVEDALVKRAFETATSLTALRRHSRAASETFSTRWERIPDALPLPSLARAAGGVGFVDYLTDPDGVVRWTPLWVRHADRLYPQIGLSLAMAHLDVEMDEVMLVPGAIEIPLPSGVVRRIPVNDTSIGDEDDTIDHIMRIPWFGPVDHWQVMYDYTPPRFQQPRQYITAEYVLRVPRLTEKIQTNLMAATDALGAAGQLLMSSDALEAFMATLPSMTAVDDLSDWQTQIETMTSEIDASGMMDVYGAMTRADLDAELAMIEDEAERSRTALELNAFLAAARALPVIRKQLDMLNYERQRVLADLRQKLKGRSVLVGWAATASGDVKPTPLHARCPGVLAHAMVFNAIMTGETWRAAPAWVDVLTVVGIALCATFAAAWLSPLPAAILTVVFAGGFSLVTGFVVFDWGNVWSGAAAPLAGLVLVWAGCTIYRFVDEQRERARITRRFRSYVDPALVDYVIEHPRHLRLEGQQRELTVVFTDLAGFTAISETLRERTVGLLNEYMGEMVPLIRAQRGYVNKFLGDGIMFFYGAPMPNSDHAADALATVLAMNAAMHGFNERLLSRDLPCVAMRAGVASGLMIVGDAGPAQSTDYTVLGDTVNLAARLESANKAMDSAVLINERTKDMAGDRFLYRPIGKLQVVGKKEGVMTYEPLAWKEQASTEDHELASATTTMVQAYLDGQFQACLDAADHLKERFSASALTRLYMDRCRRYLDEPMEGSFTGVIELSVK